MSLRQQLARRLAEISRRGIRLEPARGLVHTDRTLAERLPEGREWAGTCGVCWVRTEDLARWSGTLVARLGPALASEGNDDASPCARESEAPAPDAVRTVAALDIETCGFASVPVFLVGLLETDGRRLVLHQALARDYGEEPALLEWTTARIVPGRRIVTFNGRSFDIPFLRDRQRYHRQQVLGEIPHTDLLPVARRIWKPDLPDCRLQTLERHLTGRMRSGDISGRDIPDAYHAFVDTGNARHIATIIEHNRRDLLVLMELFAAAWEHLTTQRNDGQ